MLCEHTDDVLCSYGRGFRLGKGHDRFATRLRLALAQAEIRFDPVSASPSVSHGFRSRVKTKPLRRRASRPVLTRQHAMRIVMDVAERGGRKEVMHMATYRIIRIYDVPADNPYQATDRMMEALVLHVERDYHVIDYVKAPEDADGKGRRIDLTPPKGWLSMLLQELAAQISGKPTKTKWVKPEVYKGKSMHEQELAKRQDYSVCARIGGSQA